MLVKDTEKSGEFEDLRRNGCKRYWKVRRIWGLENEMVVKDTEKSGEFEICKEMLVKDIEKKLGEFEYWRRNGCKR